MKKSQNQKMTNLTHWLSAYVDAKRNTNTSTIGERMAKLNHKFKCYNPINTLTDHIIPKLTFNGNPSATKYFETLEAGDTQIVMQDLLDRYDVLGDQSQMDKTICMIFIHYKGFVPEPCDCNNTTAVEVETAAKRLDHGVTHHGDTYETTAEMDDMIAFLRDQDILLYDIGRKVFAQQVREKEKKYGVKICDKIKKY